MKRSMHTHYGGTSAYQTLDGSWIRELMHPQHHGNQRQSLAEATIPAGFTTALHLHHGTEELYHVSHGHGMMTLGDESFPVEVGDTVCISPGTPHQISNTGSEPLRILCVCTPPYSHEDTELLHLA
jgi:mannose-6-phosphate isomerase-like protein (cupin superfamily)